MGLLNIIINKVKKINFKKKEQPTKMKARAKVSLKVIRKEDKKEDKTEIETPIQQINQNRNKPQFQVLPTYNNQKIKTILNIVIGEDKEYYLCLMEDNSIKAIPTRFFK